MRSTLRTLFLSLILCLTLVLPAYAYTSGSWSPSADATYSLEYWELEDGTLEITGLTGTVTDTLTIPSTINDKTVTSIRSSAFSYSSLGVPVTFPDTLTNIGAGAFRSSGITGALTLPSGLTTLGDGAFERCSGLTGDLVIPQGVTSIGTYTFDQCGFDGTLTLPDGLASIGKYAFNKCGFTGALTLPSSLTAIGDHAFYYNQFTGDLTIPHGITTIDSYVFYGCTFNGALTLPASLTAIGDGAFGDCLFTGGLVLPQHLETLGSGAFSWCSNLTGDLVIPETFTVIPSSAFEDCGFDGTLTLPQALTVIESEAFSDCAFTGTLVLPSSLVEIGDDAFENCQFTGTLTFPDSLTYIGRSAFYGCTGFTGDLSIPDAVTTLESAAFYGCTGFTGALQLPSGITSIGYNAFRNCPFTGSLTIPSGVTEVAGYAFYGGKYTGPLTLPDGLTTIGNWAFAYCTFDGGLTLPDTVTTLGDSAFINTVFDGGPLVLSASLTSISRSCFDGDSSFTGDLVIPEGLTSISTSAFSGSSFTGDLIFPDHVVAIGSEVFSDCVFAGDVSIPCQPTTSISSAFSGTSCRALLLGDNFTKISRSMFVGIKIQEHVLLPEGITVIESSGFGSATFTGGLTLPNSLTEIGENAFHDTNFVDSDLMIPDSVRIIGARAFRLSKSSGDLTIGSGLTSVGTEGLNTSWTGNLTIEDISVLTAAGCTSCGTEFTGDLTILAGDVPDSFTRQIPFTGTLTLGEGVTSIGRAAFYSSSFTGELHLPESLTSIGSSAFASCHGFTGDLVIPDGITVLDFGVFSGSDFDGTLTLPSNLESIGDSVFRNCENLTGDLIIPDSVRTIGSFAFCECPGFDGELTLGSGLTQIGDAAFSLTNFTGDLVIASGLTTLNASFNSTSFTSIYLPTGLKEITGQLYLNELRHVYYPGTQEEFYAITNVKYLKSPLSTTGYQLHCGVSILPESISILGNDLVQPGHSILLTASILPKNATNKSVTWTSSNESVATVSNGIVTGISEGWATITAETCNGLTASRIVEVNDELFTILVKGYSLADLSADAQPLPNANVNIRGVNRTTNQNGIAIFQKSDLPYGMAYSTIGIQCDGYFDYNGTVYLLEGYDNVYALKSKDDGIHILNANLFFNSQNMDLIARDETVFIPMMDGAEVSTAAYPLSVDVDWNTYEEGTITLSGAASGAQVTLQDEASRSIAFAQLFDPRETIYITASTTDDDGVTHTVKEVLPVKVFVNPKIEVPPTQNIATGDDNGLYFLRKLNTKLALSELEKVATSVTFRDGVLRMEYTGKDESAQVPFALFNGQLDGKAGPAVSVTGSVQIPLMDLYGGEWSGSLEVKVEQKAEHLPYSASDNTTKNSAPLTKLLNHSYDFMLSGVPCYIDMSLSAGASGKVTLHGPYDKIYYSGQLNGTGHAALGGGVGGGIGTSATGDDVALKLGIEGALDVELPVTLTATSLQDTDVSFDPSIHGTISGKATLKLMVVNLEETLKLGGFTWDKNGARWDEDGVLSTLGLEEADSMWQYAGRSYLENGGGMQYGLSLLSADDERQPQVTYENIVPTSDAVITVIDGTPYLLFTMDDIENQDVYNNLRGAYRVWNGSGWSDAEWISTDDTADSALAADGIFAAWEDNNRALTASDDITSMLCASEISVAVFNGKSYLTQTLTNDDFYDYSVSICASGDKAMVAWLTNTAASLTGAEGITSARYAIYDGTSWSDIVTVSDIGAVTNLNVTYDGSAGTIYYKTADGTFYRISTTDNRPDALYDDIGRYAVKQVGNTALLAWFDSDRVLHIMENGTEVHSIETDFAPTENPIIVTNGRDAAVFWLQAQGIYYAHNMNGTWTDLLCLQSDDALLQGLSGQMLSDGSYTLSYLRTENGISDLMTLTAIPGPDLMPMSLETDAAIYRENGIVDYTVSIFNNGETTAKSVTVSVYDEEENLVYTTVFAGNIRPGKIYVFNDQFAPADGSVLHDYVITVTTADDYHSGNNSMNFSVGSTDLGIEKAQFTTDETGASQLQVFVSNNGSTNITDGTLKVYKNGLDTDPIYEATISYLPSGVLQLVTFPETIDQTAVYYLQVNAPADQSTANDLYLMAYEDKVPALEADWLDHDRFSLTVNTRKVNTSVGKAIFAVESADGQTLRCETLDLSTYTAGEDDLITISLAMPTVSAGEFVHVMVVDAQWAPLCEHIRALKP